MFFQNSLQPLPRKHRCKRPSKLSTQCRWPVTPIVRLWSRTGVVYSGLPLAGYQWQPGSGQGGKGNNWRKFSEKSTIFWTFRIGTGFHILKWNKRNLRLWPTDRPTDRRTWGLMGSYTSKEENVATVYWRIMSFSDETICVEFHVCTQDWNIATRCSLANFRNNF